MSHPRHPSGAPENPYFPSADASSAPPPPLEPTGETLVASNIDVAASAATPTTEHPPRIPPSPAIPGPSNNAPQRAPPASQARSVPFRSVRNQPSAIRLRRLRAPSVSDSSPLTTIASNPQPPRSRQQGEDGAVTNRRRSSSEPLSPGAVANPTVVNMEPMPVVPEGQTPPMYVAEGTNKNNGEPEVVVPRRFMMRRRRPTAQRPAEADEDCYDSRVVDFLDVVDPEVATLSSITNIQNSLFVPSLGRLVNRRPTYDLTSLPFIPGAFPASKEDVSSIKEEPSSSEQTSDEQPYPVRRTHSISTVLTSTPQYAIIPEDNDPGHSLEGWSEEDIKLLNDHVRHLLHSRRSKLKQRFKAFGKYARRPLGFLVTLYATLITLFGLAWVLFLIGWIYVGEKQLYVIDVIDQVLVALFAVMGDGLIPWRLYDTYNILWINHFHHKTLKLRKKLLLPKLEDKNDLPTDPNDPSHRIMVDLEAQRVKALKKKSDEENQEDSQKKDDYFPVLSDEEQAKLVKYQAKLAKSHTFYKPHETSTHRAFPHALAMTIILLLDLHSCLQVSLGVVTWSIPYERRPAAATTAILCCSITVNALAGILISVGDRRTRKKDVVERLVRMELTGEVMEKMVKERKKEEREKEGKNGWDGKRSKSRSRSRSRRVSEEGRSGRRSLDALTGGFKRKSLERRRSENSSSEGTSSSGSSLRKEKEKVGRFDPSTATVGRKSMTGTDGTGGGLGVVAEADHEPHYQHVLGYQRPQQRGEDEETEKETEMKMKIPGAFEE